ncbi:MAG: type II secretion system F family protein [Proteobacteria bacterium]|nr:type II secretion system F family protein [Pseudomonadota bacterium]MBU1716258.1 type II secretion system F family protein [Pseudomonadota bacterium]
MPVFQYEAIDHSGKISSGKYTAEIISEVEKWLLKNGQTPINIEIDSKTDQSGDGQARPISFIEKLKGVNLEDLILFCRQIATMLSAGVSILKALEIMALQVRNPVLRQIIIEVAASIESGANLSDSFALYPKVFSQLFRNVVLIGEESGNLDNSFEYLAVLYENEKEVKEKIKSATRYPKIVVGAMFSAILFLMTFVVPKFVKLFASSKVALPLPTRILITTSHIFTEYFLIMMVAIVLIILAYRFALNYEEFIMFRDRLLLKTPIFGDLAVKIFMSRFCRVFSVLTKSGIDIIKTINLSSSALSNLVLYKALERISAEVEKGTDLQSAMSRHPIFPAMVVQMIAVGEESGQLETMMEKVADYYDVETEYIIKNLSTLIEPILLLFLGVLVAFIALAIFLPMWNMMSVMRG